MPATVFIAPHLDDIALSCGGYARRLTAAGRRVVIVTVCTADVPDHWPLSAAAQHVHGEWRLGPRPYARRRAEDETACTVLGADAVHLGMLDAVYRLDGAGAPLYARDFIGIPPHPLDRRRHVEDVAAAVRTALALEPDARVFAPLGVGGHVDHTLVRAAVERAVPAVRLRYYEDFPYAGWGPDRLAKRYALGPKTLRLSPFRIRLRAAELDARLAAIGCYRSQMVALFGSADVMPVRVREYVSCVHGERYWRGR